MPLISQYKNPKIYVSAMSSYYFMLSVVLSTSVKKSQLRNPSFSLCSASLCDLKCVGLLARERMCLSQNYSHAVSLKHLLSRVSKRTTCEVAAL